MRPLTKRLLAILFPISLVLPSASVLLPITPVEIENRRLEFPEISIERLIEPGFYQKAFEYVRDGSPMRVWLVKLGTGLDYWVFDDSPNPTEVFKGRDDWLFFRETVDNACSEPPDVVAENLEMFASRLAEDVPTVVVTVAPSKFVVHPEHLTEAQMELTRCGHEASQELRALLASSRLAHYIDSWAIFQRLKEEGVQPYFRTDTHFNYEGSIPWIQSIVGELADIWDPSAVEDQGHHDFVGNLMRFLALQYPERVKNVIVDRGLQRQPIAGDLFTTRRYRPSVSDETPVIEEQTLVIGDSFMRLPEPSLVQYFRNITVMDWGDPASVRDFIIEAPSSDIVIIEVSELDIWSTFADTRLLEMYEAEQ